MRILCLSALLFATVCLSDSTALADKVGYAEAIVGKWIGPKKIWVFHRDGTWGVMRNETAAEDKFHRRWTISKDDLVISYPGDDHTEKGPLKIISITPSEMKLESDGHVVQYRRLPKKPKH